MMEEKIAEIKTLVSWLNAATVAYDVGKPMISDKEWDDLYFKLQKLEQETGFIMPLSPTQSIHFETVSQLNKVKHNHPMLSLEKTKDQKEIKSFLGDNSFILMAKMDGLTCSLRYLNGELVSAETRGNGEIGEDILHNAKVINSIPKHINYKDELIIDGEVICTYKDFEEFKEDYKNPRNFAAGSIRLLDSKECKKRNLTFVAWAVIKGFDSEKFFGNKLEFIEELGFITVPFSYDNNINYIKNDCEELGYPIDGLVYKFNDIEYGKSLGRTDHHFKDAMAFKFYDEEVTTRLRYIDWTMGRTGVLTPVAVFEPVELEGTIVERANLHNVSVMKEILGNCAYVGEQLVVYKSNQIIPQIREAGPKYNYEEVISAGGVSANDNPEVCPICGQPVEIRQDGIAENLYCTNPQCSGKLINIIDHFCGKKGLDIKNLSKATIEKLIDWGWCNSIEDICTLESHKDEWIKKPGFGVASVNKIIMNINMALHKPPLWRVIAAAGIPLIGTTASKALAEYCKSWDNFINKIADNFNFTTLPDFGDAMQYELTHFNYDHIKKVAEYCTEIQEVAEAAADSNSSSLEGKMFVITGKISHWKNRDELKATIENLGGKVTGSVTSKTSYLINNDINSTTAKNITAKKLNVPIITEDQFLEMIV